MMNRYKTVQTLKPIYKNKANIIPKHKIKKNIFLFITFFIDLGVDPQIQCVAFSAQDLQSDTL